ncbi:dephospho-CoA kinase [Elioraea sp. Yellowstone]|jgi:dephospho-CoA kinase|uniref:dephospho-CoA kinase n=1 Tax=Elioraea sp. Yellowstone TaxID=2592070 RepID=UPI00115214CC|nr:dephospho-CoA kinase [Elioraea sp. Yellowstone]TQF83771.1 dephospho-CoA kinase [Elioraea sp. Yellowstone]
MIVIGLTGGIGMGKSTAARTFRRLGIPVHDADAAVHRLYARGGAGVAAIAALAPEAVADGSVVREALRQRALSDPAFLARLEAAIHPLVRQEERRFLARCRRARRPLAVLDIPLLFETGSDRRVDHVVVVSAPAATQRARVLPRPGMTEARLAAIRARQMPDTEKRRRADTVIRTGLSRHHAQRAIRRLVARLREGGR